MRPGSTTAGQEELGDRVAEEVDAPGGEQPQRALEPAHVPVGLGAVVTADGSNGPYSQIGLIWARPPRAASTAERRRRTGPPTGPRRSATGGSPRCCPRCGRARGTGCASGATGWPGGPPAARRWRPGTSSTWSTNSRDMMSWRGELAPEEQERDPRADDGHGQGDGVGDPQARARQQVVGQRVAAEAVEDDQHQQGHADDPVQLPGLAEGAGEEDAAQVDDDGGHEDERRPVVHLAEHEPGPDVEAEADRRLGRPPTSPPPAAGA